MSSLDSSLTVAREAILQAGAEVMKRYEAFERIEDAPADITTDADRASQAIIFKALHESFPEDALCGEESNVIEGVPRTGSRVWIVDPIDGTRGFARKTGEFSIMVALAEEHDVVLGLVLEPALRRLTWAVKGQGCWVQSGEEEPARCEVRGTSSLGDAIVSMSRSRGAEGEARLLKAFGAASGVQRYSAGVKLAQVARGEADLYLADYLRMKDWDLCAGHILVTEAGGRVTSRSGAELRYGTADPVQSDGLLATNGTLHAEALAVVQREALIDE
jgi:3'(2'), 5'-bisphosphate nucleotidase